MNKRLWSFIIALLAFLVPTTAFACGGMAIVSPPGTYFRTNSDTNILIWFRDNTQTTVVEPSFVGNSKDFGMIMPFPSKPTIEKAPKNVFAQLDTITAPRIKVDQMALGFSGAPRMPGFSTVKVIEQKNISDYTATVLTAGNGKDLYDWLKSNNFAVKTQDKENYEYYIQKGGTYFVALKANVPNSKLENGLITDRLAPIAFTYQTNKPYLSHRIFKDTTMDMERTYNLYILSAVTYIVPGQLIVYSDRVSKDNVDTNLSLLKYNAEGQWLTRSTITVSHARAESDLYPVQVDSNKEIGMSNSGVVFNEQHIPLSAGVVPPLETEVKEYLTVEETNLPVTDTGVNRLQKIRALAAAIAVSAGLLIAGLLFLQLKFKLFSNFKRVFSGFRWSYFWTALGIAILAVIGTPFIGIFIMGLLNNVAIVPLSTNVELTIFLSTLAGILLLLSMIMSRKSTEGKFKKLLILEVVMIVVFIVGVFLTFATGNLRFMITEYWQLLQP